VSETGWGLASTGRCFKSICRLYVVVVTRPTGRTDERARGFGWSTLFIVEFPRLLLTLNQHCEILFVKNLLSLNALTMKNVPQVKEEINVHQLSISRIRAQFCLRALM
jgi:hypothetical protein